MERAKSSSLKKSFINMIMKTEMPYLPTSLKITQLMSLIRISFLIILIFALLGCSVKKTDRQRESELSTVSPQVQESTGAEQSEAQIKAIDINELDQGMEISISGSRKLEYTSIKKTFPYGIAIYLPKTKIAENFKNNIVPNELLSDIVVNYTDSDMSMVKIEFVLSQALDYTLREAEDSIRFILHRPFLRPQTEHKTLNGQRIEASSVLPETTPEPIIQIQEAGNKIQDNVNSPDIKIPGIKIPGIKIPGMPRQYTGEKVKLDFYETDIKNVFRMLKNVAGINFAIDKDVEGKVTLSLEDPVPWDQILDLVLKMNGLGYKQESNIIRIATLDTLKREQILLQDAIEERKKARESRQSLEPLITEYIPISYADAEQDIKPHIDQILTKDRGRISVDKRSNIIIIMDIREKLEQVREIIYRLDQVTPQIMIEARVVEVSRKFSRELGMGLSFERGQTANTVTNTKDFTIALNHPLSTTSSNTGTINIYNVLGSNFSSIEARIRASESKGELKIVSSPRILTLDNKKAYIKQGMELAYLERDSSGGASVKFKNIDLLLAVTPHVTPDKRIAMTVHLTKNDITTITEDGIPSLSTNEAETELLVNNKDTIVIGGIEKQTDNTKISGTPFLSKIPLIGRLFRSDSTSDNRMELLIFLTPSIIQLEQKKEAYRRAVGL
jgi:type IV pilus secretin PilQ/predicted competence protein